MFEVKLIVYVYGPVYVAGALGPLPGCLAMRTDVRAPRHPQQARRHRAG